MKRTIVILYEHVSREYYICEKLKNILDRRGYEVRIYSIHFEIYEIYKLCKNTTIDLLVVPYLYKERSLRAYLSLIKNKKILNIYNLRHEQIGALFNEHRLYPHDEFSKDRVYYSAWTEYYKQKLIQYGVPENHIFVTQNPRTDLLIFREINYDNRTEFAKKKNLNKNKKWILICESGGLISSETINRRLKLGYKEEDLYTWNEVEGRDLELTEAQINSIDSSILKEYEIIYRPHPGTKNSLNIRKDVSVDSSDSIYDWLNYVVYNGEKYFFNGCQTKILENGTTSVKLEIYNLTKKTTIFSVTKSTATDCVEAFLDAPIWDGKLSEYK